MKLSERLRKCLMAGPESGTLQKAPITVEAADLLDECEQALEAIKRDVIEEDHVAAFLRIDQTLDKLRSQERG